MVGGMRAGRQGAKPDGPTSPCLQPHSPPPAHRGAVAKCIRGGVALAVQWVVSAGAARGVVDAGVT